MGSLEDGNSITPVGPLMARSTHSGSFYYNYKGFHSLVLLAVVDSDYKFLYADVGANGATCFAQVFNLSLCLPPREPIEGDDCPLPYVIFPLGG